MLLTWLTFKFKNVYQLLDFNETPKIYLLLILSKYKNQSTLNTDSWALLMCGDITNGIDTSIQQRNN